MGYLRVYRDKFVESEQNGNIKAAYGSKLLTTLSKELTLRLGKGYSRPNLNKLTTYSIMLNLLTPNMTPHII